MPPLHKKFPRVLLCLFLITLLITGPGGLLPVWAGIPSAGSATLLNDRAADIIGATPLGAQDLVASTGLTGRGQIVGIADSGLDKGSISDIHPDLQSQPGLMPRVAMLHSYTDRELADDPNGHGTHMAATIVGSGQASGGKYQGIAPGASLYFQALLNRGGQLTLPQNITDIFTPAYAAGVRTHVNGWGSGGNSYGSTAAQVDRFVYEHPDFLPIFGAGNNGPGRATLTSQANSKNALVIGSSQLPRPAFSPEARYADQPADSSSRGPAADGRIKPELLAPGSAVISACSSLTTSNFPANSAYTRMGGSSMAAAVSGGAVALLREYLALDKGTKAPSSALIKALLVNGARTPESGPSDQGFGILDLTGTVLALREKSFTFNDEKTPLHEGEFREYRFTRPVGSGPFKAALAWVDPPAASGAASTLVNDLDLIVEAPGGKTYYGNDFSSTGAHDKINNLEQVYIPRPAAGEYIIKVQGTRVDQAGGGQPFALVYGQVAQQQLLQGSTSNQLTLADGTVVNTSSSRVIKVLNGEQVRDLKDLEAGSQVYRFANTIYIFSKTWESGGVQLLGLPEGELLMEISPQSREGGYYLDPLIPAGKKSIMVNGEELSNPEQFPAGAHIHAVINPLFQSIWQLEAGFEEVKGYISDLNQEQRSLRLLRAQHNYQLAPWTAVAYDNQLSDSCPGEAPYGYGEKADLTRLVPGMKVTLLLTPGTRLVDYIRVERTLVLGRVEEVIAGKGKVVLENGISYELFPGSKVYRDGQEVELGQIHPGDLVAGLLLADSLDFLQLQAYSRVTYGKLIYYNDKQAELYILDNHNQFTRVSLAQNSEIYRRGALIEASALAPGAWVRIVRDPESGKALRIDLAEIEEEGRKTITGYQPGRGMLYFSDGSAYSCQEGTLVVKGGYVLSPEDLLPGETVKMSVLSAPSNYPQTLAQVEAERPAGVPVPELQASAHSLNGVLILQGYSSADRVSLYRQDGSRSSVVVTSDGSFSQIFTLLDQEQKVRLVALDSKTGAINGCELTIEAYPVQQPVEVFSDIANDPHREQILRLARQGVIHGYKDGSFRPEQPLSRLEALIMIAKIQDLSPSSVQEASFADQKDIPWWALSLVGAAREKGLVFGYPDKTLRPHQAITRSEMAAFLDRAWGGKQEAELALLPYRDRAFLPLWALESVSRGYQRGLWSSLGVDYFQPYQPVTRGEAAALLVRIMDAD